MAKRAVSTRAQGRGARQPERPAQNLKVQLKAEPSPFNASVKLFELEGEGAVEEGEKVHDVAVVEEEGRPAKRMKHDEEMLDLEPLTPVEDSADEFLTSTVVNATRARKVGSTVTKTATSGKKTRTRTKTKTKTLVDVTSTSVIEAKSPSPRKAKSSKPVPQALATPHPAPARWKEAYDAIKDMRSRIVAPVDTMGCDQAQYKEEDPKNRRFATLVSLMLSSQTKDEVTDAAVTKLRTALGGSLTVQAMVDAEEAVVSGAIGKVGFWRRKTEYLKKTAVRLRDEFDSDVPKTVDELCSLPGVGPKMAFLALQVAWNLNHGIGVDVHVHRITNRLGWHKPPSKTPEETRLNLQSWLPIELHPEINHLLVGFGQTVCLPVAPKCDSCSLSSNGLCPSARKIAKTGKVREQSRVKTSGREELENKVDDSPPKVQIAIEEE